MNSVGCDGPRAGVGAAFIVVLSLMLGGCSSGEPDASATRAGSEPTSKPAPTATSAASTGGACALLSSQEVADLAGQPLGQPEPGTTGGLPSCQWGDPSDAGVQVISVPASVWAEQLPLILQQLKASGIVSDAENQRKLRAAARRLNSGAVTSQQACGMLSTLLEIQGHPSGTSRTVNVIPTRQQPQAISGQGCSRGTYTSVLLVAPNLSGSDREVRRTLAALIRAHERGLG